MGYFVKNRGSGRAPSGTVIPTGDTNNRPSTPVNGLIRFNSLTSVLEYYNGTAWLDIISPGVTSIVVDNFTGDSLTTVFQMSQEENTNEQILVFVGGVYQTPGSTYNVSLLGITFTSAPPLSSSISIIHNIGTIT